jgi:hypothetical protein
MKKSPVELKVKVRLNPVKYICIDRQGTYTCYGEKDLKACLLDHPTAKAYKVSKEVQYEIEHNVILK